MLRYVLSCLILALPVCASAADLTMECRGKTRFIHRGAASTTPQDDRRLYTIHDQTLDTTQCTVVGSGFSCSGLTEHHAMRTIEIDMSARTVTDRLQMPTSELIFDGRCD